MKLLWISQTDNFTIVYAESPVKLLGMHLFSRKRKYRYNGNGWKAFNSLLKVSGRKRKIPDNWLKESSRRSHS